MVVLPAYCRGKSGKANGFRRAKIVRSSRLSEQDGTEKPQLGHFPVKISPAGGMIVAELALQCTPKNKQPC
jgi:hypothetical protein